MVTSYVKSLSVYFINHYQLGVGRLLYALICYDFIVMGPFIFHSSFSYSVV